MTATELPARSRTTPWLKVVVIAIFSGVLFLGFAALMEGKLGGGAFVTLALGIGFLMILALGIERIIEFSGKFGQYGEISAKMTETANFVSDISHELSVMVAGEIMRQGRIASDNHLTESVERISRVVGFLRSTRGTEEKIMEIHEDALSFITNDLKKEAESRTRELLREAGHDLVDSEIRWDIRNYPTNTRREALLQVLRDNGVEDTAPVEVVLDRLDKLLNDGQYIDREGEVVHIFR